MIILILLILALFIYLARISNRLSRVEHWLNKIEKSSKDSSVPDSTPKSTQSLGDNPLLINLSDISGVKWLTIIGVLALILGLGFFLKYAIDQNWITPLMRVALGVVVGSLLTILGELWKEKYKSFAHAISGGGLAIVYFSIYAAFGFYNLISSEIAFLLLIVLSGVGVFLSYRYSSKVLAILSVLGGYLAPLIISTGIDRHTQLFIYITLLNIAVLIMMTKRFWLEPLYVLLIGSAFNFGLWAASFSTKENLLASVAFLLTNFLITSITLGTLTRKRIETSPLYYEESKYLSVFHIFLSSCFFVATTGLLFWSYKDYLSLTHLLAGLITFISYAIIDRLEDKQVNYTLSLLGVVFLFSSICWYFTEFTQGAYLLALGMLGVIVGIVQKRKELRFWGLSILVISKFVIIAESYPLDAVFLWNSKFGLLLLSAALLLISGYLYNFKTEPEERPLGEFAKIYAAGIIWFAVSAEIVNNFKGLDSSNFSNLLLSLWWIGYAVVLGIVSAMRHNAVLRKGSIALFALAIIKVFAYDVLALDLGYRIVSFITLGVILLATAFYYQKHKDKMKQLWEVKEQATEALKYEIK